MGLTIGEQERVLLAGGAALFIECAHLSDEVVCFVADGIPLPLDARGRYRGCVVYRVSELQMIRSERMSAQALRDYHAHKKKMGSLVAASGK